LHTFRNVLAHYSSGWPTLCRQFRGIATGSEFAEFPSLYHSICQIPQCHHTNLYHAPLIVILETCNLWEVTKIYTFRRAKKSSC